MTESEWLACDDPRHMLEFREGKVSERRLRLFAVACCFRISHLLTDGYCLQFVDIGERFADRLATEDELEVARENAEDAMGASHRAATAAGWSANSWITNAATIAAGCILSHWQNWVSDIGFFETPLWAARAIAGPAAHGMLDDTPEREAFHNEQRVQCHLVRDIFGNPFRPIAFNPAWLTSTVLTLARGIYDERAFDRMPILADALQDAGCDNDDILTHCRGAGPHVRGCWVVDLVLGKS
jgi:hypothetical protein